MAYRMQYSDDSGNDYNDSYWRIVQVNISVADKNANIVFHGYKSKQARNNNKAPIASKQYTCGEVYTALIDSQKDVVAKAYELCRTLEEVDFFASAIED